MPIIVMMVATTLYIRIDVIMLDYYLGKELVAQYSAGYQLLEHLMTLSNFMIIAVFPNFAKTARQGGCEFQLLYRGILVLFAKYLLPLAIILSLFSRTILDLLYGPEYASGWPSLSVLMAAAAFAWVNAPSGTILLSLNKQHIYMWATFVSVIVNVVGNMLLIPILGPVGAAVATVVTEIAICGFSLLFIYRETGYLPWFNVRQRAR